MDARILSLLFTLLTAGCRNINFNNSTFKADATINSTAGEDDWWLPLWVVKAENSGLYDYPSTVQHPDAFALNVTWKMLNPKEDEYDWSILDQAVASGQPFWLRIFSSDARHIPTWLKDKYSSVQPLHYTPEGGKYVDPMGGVSPGLFYPIWQPGIFNAFKKFMVAFKNRNYCAKNNFKFMYAPGAWRWDEWEVVFTAAIKNDLGSADAFFGWFKSYITSYTDAFAGYEYKLVYTGFPQMDKCEGDVDFAYTLNNIHSGNNLLTDFAVRKGMSVRVGSMEYYNGYCHTPSWGCAAKTINGKRYQSVDYAYPIHRNQNSIIGTENEGFGDEGMLPGTNHYFFVKMGILKALNMGVNWLNMSDKCYSLAPKLVEYARKTMGKNARTSPDAWVALREWHDATYKGIAGSVTNGTIGFFGELNLPYRNWEHFLIQRDVDSGGHTAATQYIGENSYFLKNNGDSYEAVRTDIATNNRFMYFAVDDSFMFNNNAPIAIKVTYWDNNAATWQLQYDGGPSNRNKTTGWVKNINDNRWKTKTFFLNDAKFTNGLRSRMDFRIYNSGNTDVTIRFVRVIKLSESSLR